MILSFKVFHIFHDRFGKPPHPISIRCHQYRGKVQSVFFPIGYGQGLQKERKTISTLPIKKQASQRLCLLSQTTLRFEPTSTKKFSPLPLRHIKLIPYLCSPMKYLNKPSEKIICTESIGSFTLNFQRYHIGGQTVGRLFLFKNNN